jgi:hypothetical protein
MVFDIFVTPIDTASFLKLLTIAAAKFGPSDFLGSSVIQ